MILKQICSSIYYSAIGPFKFELMLYIPINNFSVMLGCSSVESAPSTVNSEIFTRVLFLFILLFMKIRHSRNGGITLSFTYIGKSCLSCKFLMSLIYLLRLLAKISEFTVVRVKCLAQDITLHRRYD